MAYVQLKRFDGTNWIGYDLKNTESMKPVDISPTIKGVVNPYGRRASIALGTFSTALGYDSIAKGNSSTALGKEATAQGDYSTALGHYSIIWGNNSVALGNHSAIDKDNSTALGGYSEARGDSSTALGYNSIAKGSFSTALGYYSSTSATDSNIVQIGLQSGLSAVYGGASYSVRSDMRDKTDIKPVNHCLEFINKIEPIQFVRNNREKYLLKDDKNKELYNKYGMCDYDKNEWTKGTKKGTRKNVGVKAQQVLEVLREVYHDDNYANIVNDNLYDVKAKGETPNVENKLTVAYSNFIPFLIGAIQEQQKQIDELKAALQATK